MTDMRPLFLRELALAGGIALQAGRNASLLGSSALAVGFVATVYTLGALARRSGPRLGSRLADLPVVLPISGSLLRGLSSIGNGTISSLGLHGITPAGRRLRNVWLDRMGLRCLGCGIAALLLFLG